MKTFTGLKPTTWLGLLGFVLLSYTLIWLASIPLWLSPRGLQNWWAALLLAGVMFVPSVATLVVVGWICPEPNKVALLGLRFGVKGWWRYWLFGWLVIPGFSLAAPLVGALLGLFPMDLRGFSAFRNMLQAAPGGKEILKHVPIQLLVGLQLINILIAPVLNAVFAFGEELGWRGYLLPRLLPLGQWPALLVSGVIWGAWHAPVILLGYNYPAHPRLGVFLMVIFCVIFGILFGWTRLATGSIWPAVIAHGALNGSAGIPLLLQKAGTSFDTAQAGITGWSGWLLPLCWILGLVLAGRLPTPQPPVTDAQERRSASGVSHE